MGIVFRCFLAKGTKARASPAFILEDVPGKDYVLKRQPEEKGNLQRQLPFPKMKTPALYSLDRLR